MNAYMYLRCDFTRYVLLNSFFARSRLSIDVERRYMYIAFTCPHGATYEKMQRIIDTINQGMKDKIRRI